MGAFVRMRLAYPLSRNAAKLLRPYVRLAYESPANFTAHVRLAYENPAKL